MLLKIKNLTKHFNGIKAVNNCNFEIKENSITGLIGPNGAGKTTIFNLITGMYAPNKGKIIFKGNPITNLKPYQIANQGISRTFQLIRLFPNLTVMENLLLAKKQSGEDVLTALFKSNLIKKELKLNHERCLEFLKLVGLEDKINTLAVNLSFGQRKLAELARCLATEAELLLLDEPVSGVNPIMREKIKKTLLKLKKQGKTILIIEHDMKFVMNICETVIAMDEGQEIVIGSPKKVQNNKKVLEAYLGEKVKL